MQTNAMKGRKSEDNLFLIQAQKLTCAASCELFEIDEKRYIKNKDFCVST